MTYSLVFIYHKESSVEEGDSVEQPLSCDLIGAQPLQLCKFFGHKNIENHCSAFKSYFRFKELPRKS